MTAETAAPDGVPLRQGLFEHDADGGITLLGSRCGGCGTTYFPAHALCVRCFSAQQMRPARLSRQGTVYTYSVVHQSTPEFPTPYVLAYVDLPEGVRVLAQLAEVSPEAVRMGMPVELVAARAKPAQAGTPDVLTFRFRPAREDNHD